MLLVPFYASVQGPAQYAVPEPHNQVSSILYGDNIVTNIGYYILLLAYVILLGSINKTKLLRQKNDAEPLKADESAILPETLGVQASHH